jgi:hypothetical protein
VLAGLPAHGSPVIHFGSHCVNGLPAWMPL